MAFSGNKGYAVPACGLLPPIKPMLCFVPSWAAQPGGNTCVPRSRQPASLRSPTETRSTGSRGGGAGMARSSAKQARRYHGGSRLKSAAAACNPHTACCRSEEPAFEENRGEVLQGDLPGPFAVGLVEDLRVDRGHVAVPGLQTCPGRRLIGFRRGGLELCTKLHIPTPRLHRWRTRDPEQRRGTHTSGGKGENDVGTAAWCLDLEC